MTQTLLRSTLRIAAVATLGLVAGCTFGFKPGDGIGFSCTSDDDCVAGFFCDFGEAEGSGATGVCVSGTAGGNDCVDRDRDGAFFGECEDIISAALDCNDDDPNVRPGAEEICDAIDNDCDTQTDEELPVIPCNRQLGVCAGTVIGCVDGAYPDCEVAGVYPETFESSEASCDELDNDCDGVVDPTSICECNPTETGAVECGNETGSCTRGIRVCGDDSRLSDCVEAVEGRVCPDGTACTVDADCAEGSGDDAEGLCAPQECETDDDCGPNGFCVDELYAASEDVFDDCLPSDETGCQRNTCRYLDEDTTCTTDDDCAGGFCIGGFCQSGVVLPLEDEICNGIDDNCDGRIDDDFNRDEICGSCPYNMVVVPLAGGSEATVCVDVYEASRPDATDTDPGDFSYYAASQQGVIPWTGVGPVEADAFCRAQPYRELLGAVGGQSPIAAKTLCKVNQFYQACGGKPGTATQRDYPYGDEYVAGNCIDASLGLTGPALTGTASNCCADPEGSDADDALCDMAGNVAEWIRGLSGQGELAGGSYLDADAEVLSCGDGIAYVRDPVVDGNYAARSDIGFRCCTPVRSGP